MNNCVTCKHWMGDPVKPEEFAECEMGHAEIAVGKDCSVLKHPRTLFYGNADDKPADVMTRGDFGCIHWDGAA